MADDSKTEEKVATMVGGGTNFSSDSEKASETHLEEAVLDGSRLNAPEGPPPGTMFTPVVLDQIDPDLFVAHPKNLQMGPRAVFGGQVLGQALAAAQKTVEPGMAVHSLHAYFVRAGKNQTNIVYHVSRVRNGHSFSIRHVMAKQNGRPIFTCLASFNRAEWASVSHQAIMPSVPGPESLPTEEMRLQKYIADPRTPEAMRKFMMKRLRHEMPIDSRHVLSIENYNTAEANELSIKHTFTGLGCPSQMIWFRVKTRLPDDEHVHHAVVAYLSDAGLMGTVRVDKPSFLDMKENPMMASLDHAMWFHQPFPAWRADEWLLYVMYSPRLGDARGLSHGHIFTRDGRLVVSCTQEGLVRLGSDREKQPAQTHVGNQQHRSKL